MMIITFSLVFLACGVLVSESLPEQVPALVNPFHGLSDLDSRDQNQLKMKIINNQCPIRDIEMKFKAALEAREEECAQLKRKAVDLVKTNEEINSSGNHELMESASTSTDRSDYVSALHKHLTANSSVDSSLQSEIDAMLRPLTRRIKPIDDSDKLHTEEDLLERQLDNLHDINSNTNSLIYNREFDLKLKKASAPEDKVGICEAQLDILAATASKRELECVSIERELEQNNQSVLNMQKNVLRLESDITDLRQQISNLLYKANHDGGSDQLVTLAKREAAKSLSDAINGERSAEKIREELIGYQQRTDKLIEELKQEIKHRNDLLNINVADSNVRTYHFY